MDSDSDVLNIKDLLTAVIRQTSLIEDTLVPLLKKMGEKVDNVANEMQIMHVSRERDKGRVARLEELFGSLKCSENTDIMRGLGSRVANLESQFRNGHAQNTECREKNKLVDEALRLARRNKEKNEEQERRHQEQLKDQKDRNQKIINRLWALIVVIIGAASTVYFTHLWNLPK